MQTSEANRWLRTRKPLARPRVRLLCLPYAGGAATIFHAWPDALPADVEVRALQLPGRQDRLSEPPLTSVAAIVEQVVAALAALPHAPLLVYGHSLGAMVGFELSRRLSAAAQPPLALIAAARGAPHLPADSAGLYRLGDAAFKAELHRRYGTPQIVLQDDELMALAMPSLRSDFTAFGTYQHAPGAPLEVPVTVLHGRKDVSVSRAEAEAWRQLTTQPLALHELDASHLFVDTHRPQVLAQVAEVLRQLAGRP